MQPSGPPCTTTRRALAAQILRESKGRERRDCSNRMRTGQALPGRAFEGESNVFDCDAAPSWLQLHEDPLDVGLDSDGALKVFVGSLPPAVQHWRPNINQKGVKPPSEWVNRKTELLALLVGQRRSEAQCCDERHRRHHQRLRSQGAKADPSGSAWPISGSSAWF